LFFTPVIADKIDNRLNYCAARQTCLLFFTNRFLFVNLKEHSQKAHSSIQSNSTVL